jgi:hypothetical protein
MLVVPILVVTTLVDATPAEDWQAIPVYQDQQVEVRLRVRGKASLAVPDWLVIEFENKTDKPLPIGIGGNYGIRNEVANLRTGKGVSSGGLASGNDYDMLGGHRKALPVGPYKNVRRVSDYSAALLGLPPPEGWRVRGRFHFDLDLKGRGRIETPPDGVPFEFEWHHPGEAGYAAMRQRLKQLLKEPEYEAHHVYILDAHLKVPEVARVLTRDDLLRALSGREGSFDGRWSLLQYLNRHFRDDAELRAYFLRRLNEGVGQTVEDLANGAPWHSSFAERCSGCTS